MSIYKRREKNETKRMKGECSLSLEKQRRDLKRELDVTWVKKESMNGVKQEARVKLCV